MKQTAKKWAAIMLVAIMTLSVGIWAQAEDLSGVSAASVYEKAADSVVGVFAMGEVWSREAGVSTVEQDYGTGLYIDARGYVLTCWHLISGADFVEVELVDGERLRAEAILKDDSVDVAVLKLEAPLEQAEPLSMGAAAVGERVFALGNQYDAFGLYPLQLTEGLVSGARSDSLAANFSRAVKLLRTNASLGAGSCGGALLNEEGALVGMLVGLVDDDGVEYESLFASAIPADTLSKIVSDLIEYGAVKRPRMGVMVVDNDGPEEALKNYPPCGSLVSEVEAGGPADQAGILVYDVITAINGVRTHSFTEMSAELEKHEAGEVITVTVYRCADPVTGQFLDEASYLDLQVMLDVLD